MSRRAIIAIVLFGAVLAGAATLRLLATPGVGGHPTLAPPRDAVEWRLRSERVGIGLVVGAALAVSGVMLQALLRNPLAEPGVLGVTSGAGLGVVASIYIGFRATGAVAVYSPPAGAAVLGAFGALAVVFALGQRRGLVEPVALVLIGVVVSVICGAGVVFLQHLLPAQGWAVAMQWTLGGLSDEAGTPSILAVGALTLAGVAIGVWLGPAMDAASLGEDESRSVGVPLAWLRAALFTLAGALAAGSVLLAGPIGFVGLVCPHAVRVVAGPSHRPLVIGSALAGGALIIAADAAVRLVDLGAGRLPIGVLTALVGGPSFLWLLRRREVAP